MRLCSIASGSSGNCIYVGSEEAHVLVDVGISGKSIEKGLNSLDLTGKDVDGILITHEHSDHLQKIRNPHLHHRWNSRCHASDEIPWKNAGGADP